MYQTIIMCRIYLEFVFFFKSKNIQTYEMLGYQEPWLFAIINSLLLIVF